MSQTILALDASTEALSVALLHQGQQYHFFDVCPQQHAQRILAEVDGVLAQAGIDISDVDVIGYCQGPGSFTGVRISVSVAQGLAFSTNIPVVGVSSLAMMAQQAIAQGAQRVLAAIDARMGEVYLAAYESVNGMAELQGEQQVLKPEDVTNPFADTIAVGTGWQSYPALLTTVTGLQPNADITLPDSRYMLALVEAALALGHSTKPCEAQPVYLRDTVTWKKLPGRE